MSETLSGLQQTLFAEASPAKTSQWPESGRAWLENGAASGTSFVASLTQVIRDLLSSRMSPAFYRLPEDGTLPPSFAGWQTAGIGIPGACLTVDISEWPNDAAECSLSEALLKWGDPWVVATFRTEEAFLEWLLKYSLSETAIAGIERRAAKRGKELPEWWPHRLTRTATG